MGQPGPLARTIRSKLAAALQPTLLRVEDESARHGGPPGRESHFAVLVVSPRFAGLPPLQRHRLVHDALRDELGGPLHALAIVARTPEQWESDPRVPPRPPCLGGSKHERRDGGSGGGGDDGSSPKAVTPAAARPPLGDTGSGDSI